MQRVIRYNGVYQEANLVVKKPVGQSLQVLMVFVEESISFFKTQREYGQELPVYVQLCSRVGIGWDHEAFEKHK